MVERLFDPSEVAAILRLNRYTVMDWLRAGKLRGVKVGSKLWRVKESDLEDFIRLGEQFISDKARGAREGHTGG